MKLKDNINQLNSDVQNIKASIINKGVEIPDGTPLSEYGDKITEVYKTGRDSAVDKSKIIEKTASGEYIALDDVSEVPHDINAVLTSGGKNLWKHGDVTFQQAVRLEATLLAGVTYTFSAVATSTDTESDTCLIQGKDSENNEQVYGRLSRNTRSTVTFTPTFDATSLTLMAGSYYGNSGGDTATFKDIMLEEKENLLNQSEIKTGTESGITLTYLEDEDCFLLNGTAESTTNRFTTYMYLDGVKNANYTIRTTYISGTVEAEGLNCLVYLSQANEEGKNDNWLNTQLKNSDNYTTKALERNMIGAIWLYFNVGVKFDNYKFKIKLSNDVATEYEPYKETLTDYSGVSVTRCGNNLITYPYYATETTVNGVTFTINEDKSITANGTATANTVFYLRARWETIYRLRLYSGTYYLSGSPDGARSTTYYTTLECEQSGEVKYMNDLTGKGVAFTLNEPADITVAIVIKPDVTVDNLVFKPMLNFGTTPLPYEPYNGQTIQANPDGTIEGITSQSPYMYMTTDNQNVTINADYHKSYGIQTEYDRFWDVFQENGKRTDYQTAFRYQWWTDAIFKPKYLIQPTNAENMFQRTAITDIRMVDLTKVTSVGSLCNSSTDGIRYVGRIGNSSITTFGSVFGWCYRLISVDKMIVGENAQFANAFTDCRDLESITFEGTIGYSIAFPNSSKLNKASILSVFNALSSTKTGQSLTLHTTAVNNAFETSAGTADGSTSTEWTNLVASKSNWTISLV